MPTGIDPKVDFVFKLLFGNEANVDLLIDLLNEVLALPPHRAIVAVESLNPTNDKKATDDKLSILDVKVRDASGRYFNVEMQMVPVLAYPSRVLYYRARLYQGQLHESEKYFELMPTYSISFLDHVLFANAPRWHWHFQLRDVREPAVLFSDDESIHIVELPKFTLNAAQLSTGFDRWCYFLRHGEELEHGHLPEPLRAAPIEKAMRVLHMVSQSEIERHRYDDQVKARRDLAGMMDAREAIGREIGEKLGREIGALIGRIGAMEENLKLEATPQSTLNAMTLEQLTDLAERLNQQKKERN